MYTDEEIIDLKQLGSNIRRLRTMKDFSQEGFADAVGLHRTYMGGVERGERNISILNLLKIIRKLEVSPAEIFSDIVS
jgi:transcriptional regulator with XRE-family HTH domain